MADFKNPFRPGAGHLPPYLAGREKEKQEFLHLLEQRTILENMVLTGLRGVGKTVLLESLKSLALEKRWLWVGADLTESASLGEKYLATRLCTDLALVTSSIVIFTESSRSPGFTTKPTTANHTLSYEVLMNIYEQTPGLSLDKIKAVLEKAWEILSQTNDYHGIIFAYDEAQNLTDHAKREQFPASLLLDAFQSLQRQDLPLMLVLAGLPTLFPKLVEARTFAERMFHVTFLESLSPKDSREAILKPINKGTQGVVKLSDSSVDTIIKMSGGYPYFIQFICKEVYDAFLHLLDRGEQAIVPAAEIERKLDADFFAGRWARATDRQRNLLSVIAQLQNNDGEFTVQEIVENSHEMEGKPFSSSHASQMLVALSNQGLVFKNRHGKYSFAVPLLGQYILRQRSS